LSLISRISRGAIGFRADVSGTPAPWDDYWYTPVGMSSASGMRVTADTSKRIASVLACVGIIGRNMAMMPKKILTEASGGGNRQVPSHPVYDVIANRPNDLQTGFEFYQMMQGHVELRGNAYAEIKPGRRGAVDQLVPMHPDRVIVERLSSGRLRYKYTDPLINQTRTLVQEEVFHLRNFSDDGFTGQSTVAMSSDVFGTALAQQDYGARFFQNDARPGGVIEGTNFRDKTDEEAFRESWQQSQTGANRHKTALLPFGLTYKEIGVSPVDAQLLDARKFSRIEICSIFGVPPHLIGETEKTATYASVEQFNIMFAVQCLLPRVVMWEQAIQRDLILSDKYFPKFSMAALLRGDTASRFAAYKVAIENGWMSPNDVRMLEDLNPIPGGDTYWRPLNWAPLTQTSAPSDTAITDQGENAGSMNDAAHLGRLKLLASSAAERCVRKEVLAVRKMIERNATDEDYRSFYTDHAGFISEVLRVPVTAAMKYTDSHAGAVSNFAALENIERRGVIELTELAVGGLQ
jgi:HK97 family phage portal protein